MILTFSPFASSSIVSMRGILLPLQILEIVDFGILVAAEIWRTVKFLLYIYSCNNIFMVTTPLSDIVSMIVTYNSKEKK